MPELSNSLKGIETGLAYLKIKWTNRAGTLKFPERDWNVTAAGQFQSGLNGRNSQIPWKGLKRWNRVQSPYRRRGRNSQIPWKGLKPSSSPGKYQPIFRQAGTLKFPERDWNREKIILTTWHSGSRNSQIPWKGLKQSWMGNFRDLHDRRNSQIPWKGLKQQQV